MKIGLIQNEAVAGDLSHNLRLIVQGYRKCLDEGAELVVASAQALDGAFLHDLAARSSFRLQACAALQTLASETSLPLLLASYAGRPGEAPELRPYLLSGGEVQPLSNDNEFRLCGQSFYLHAGAMPPMLPKGCGYALLMPTEPWWLGQQEEWRMKVASLARESGSQVLLLRGVACTEGQLMPGGSMAATPHGGVMELPLYTPAAQIWRTGSRRTGTARCSSAGEELLSAVCYGLRSTLQQSRYEALAIDAAAPHAPLLMALARLAVGARHTIALVPEKSSTCAPAGKCLALKAEYAGEHGYLLLNGLSLKQLLLGEHPRPAVLGGAFAPLAEAYDSELELLRTCAIPRLPQTLRALLTPDADMMLPEEETELRMLAEYNAAPAEIQAQLPGADETRLRKLQRRMDAAAEHRYGRPCPLRLRRRLTHLPHGHRLRE